MAKAFYIFLALLMIGIFAILFVVIITKSPHDPNTQEPFSPPFGTTTEPSSSNGELPWDIGTPSATTTSQGSSTPAVSGKKPVRLSKELLQAKAEYLGGESYTLALDVDRYSLYYDNKDHYVQITLLSRPLGVARSAGEAKLIEVTGMSEEELCASTVFVYAMQSVIDDPTDYGLSFCPGSTDLTWF